MKQSLLRQSFFWPTHLNSELIMLMFTEASYLLNLKAFSSLDCFLLCTMSVVSSQVSLRWGVGW